MKEAQNPEDVRQMADEVARLMVDRFGGARRGEHAGLQTMLRRRGGALPRRLRKQAQMLAQADVMSGSPKIARQMDFGAVNRAHAALTRHMEPLGQVSRWQHRAINFAASVLFGLLVLGGIVLWVMVRRGHL